MINVKYDDVDNLMDAYYSDEWRKLDEDEGKDVQDSGGGDSVQAPEGGTGETVG